VANFYQAYLNAFAPHAYYNSSANAIAISGALSTHSARAVVSDLHAIALGILLLLLVVLLSITLLKQPPLNSNSHSLNLYSGTMLNHVMASGHLPEVIRPLLGLEEPEILAKLTDLRFSVDDRGRIVIEDRYRAGFIELSKDLITQFDTVLGIHPDFRPALENGIMLTGTFTRTPAAATLSNAAHFIRDSTPVTVRFSGSAGIPLVHESPNAHPCGFAVRFHLGESLHYDTIAQSSPFFPAATRTEFLEYLGALASTPGTNSPTPIELFLESHPAADSFIRTLKHPPTSFARECYFGLNAVKFINSKGATCYGRYLIEPDAGPDEAEKISMDPNVLFEELPRRLAQGSIKFRLKVQVAEDGDTIDDVTVHWPEDRRIIDLGELTLDTLVSEHDHERKQLVFNPISSIQGIEHSDDALLELRAALSLISGRRRRVVAKAL
jgi:catalase